MIQVLPHEAVLLPENFRTKLAAAVRSIQWSYAIFWAPSPIEPGMLEWLDGYYNGGIKTRKTVQAGKLAADKLALQRSEQLRELYMSLLEGDDDQHLKRPIASLAPEDLSDGEWYYLVCMTFMFNAGEGLPGRTYTGKKTNWLCDAQEADSIHFSRSLLAKSASIQTVACFPLLGGVVEIGATEMIDEDPDLLQRIAACLIDISKPVCLEYSFSPRSNDDYRDPLSLAFPGVETLDDNHDRHHDFNDDCSTDSMDDCSQNCCNHMEDSAQEGNVPADDIPYIRIRSILGNANNPTRKLFGISVCSSFKPWKNFSSGGADLRMGSNGNILKRVFTYAQSKETKCLDKKTEESEMMLLVRGLEAKVMELESCLDMAENGERHRSRSHEMMEQTSGNYENSNKRKASGEAEVKLSLQEEVTIEMSCPYREYVLVDIMDEVQRLHLEPHLVQSNTLDGVLTLKMKTKFRGSASVPAAAIKHSLWRVLTAGL